VHDDGGLVSDLCLRRGLSRNSRNGSVVNGQGLWAAACGHGLGRGAVGDGSCGISAISTTLSAA